MTQRHPITPVMAPKFIDNIFTDDENKRLFNALRTGGPWRTIAGIYFKSVEELLSVSIPQGVDPTTLQMSDFMTPAFRGFFGNNGMVYEDELHDIFYSKKLLDYVKAMHRCQYGAPFMFQFNILGPSHGLDHGHFDGGSWRGMDPTNTPAWLMSVMMKSGLFDRWAVKAGQVIAYYYELAVDGGFTYWPDGPERMPQRFAAPFWNSGVITDNQRMFHRGEACGPREKRDLAQGMTLSSLLHTEGDDWVVTTEGVETVRYPTRDMRILLHYDAHVFIDMADVKRYYDHTDDLTRDQVFEMLVDDLKRRGVAFDVPSDPLNDRQFIAALNRTYAMRPTRYPDNAQPDIPGRAQAA